jgi:hypothetical protein
VGRNVWRALRRVVAAHSTAASGEMHLYADDLTDDMALMIHTRWVVLAGPLQPAQEDLRCARVCDRLLAQTALDLRITRRTTASCADPGKGFPSADGLAGGTGRQPSAVNGGSTGVEPA